MSMPNFFYLAPKTVEQLCSMVGRYQEDCKVFAGGTDVLVRMKARSLTPRYLIDIKGIRGLDYIRYDTAEGLRIGAATTLRTVEDSDILRSHFPVIGQAAHVIGSVQIRNRGTLAGNLCNAAPSADMAPSLIAMGASLKVISSSSERVVELSDFFTGPGQTVLRGDEIVTEVRVPNSRLRTAVVYHKHSLRKAMDLAIIGVAVKIGLSEGNGKCSDVRIVLGAVAPTPVRATRAEEVLSGRQINEELIERASVEAASECTPISDVRGSVEYRKEMVKVFTRRAVKGAVRMIESSDEATKPRGR